MFRLSRVAFILFTLIVAWQVGPFFISLLSYAAPSIGSFLVFLTPDLSGHDVKFWMQFVVSAVLFGFLFKVLGVSFSFLSPKAQQFSTTKPIRRMQGLLAELMILGFFFMVSLFLVILKDGVFRPASPVGPAPQHVPSFTDDLPRSNAPEAAPKRTPPKHDDDNADITDHP